MPLFARYILRQLTGPTLLALVAFSGAVWVSQSLRFVDLIVNKGLSVGRFLYLTALLVPSLVLVILPFAAFIGALVGYHRLRAESELSIFRATGLSDLQLARGALVLGLVFVLAGYAVSLVVMPTAYRHFRELQFDIRQSLSSITVQEKVFESITDGLTVYVEERHPSGALGDIIVHDTREPEREVTLLAERGQLLSGDAGPLLRLESGSYHERGADGRLSIVRFAETTVELARDAVPGPRAAKTRELFLPALLWPPASVDDPAERAVRIAEGHERLSWPLISLALPLVAATCVLRYRPVRDSGWRALTGAAVIAVGVVLAALVSLSFVKAELALVPVLYAVPALVIVACIVLLARGRPHPEPRHA